MSRKYTNKLIIYALSVTLLITFGSSYLKSNDPLTVAATSISTNSHDFLQHAMSFPGTTSVKAAQSHDIDVQQTIVLATAQHAKLEEEIHMASYKPVKPKEVPSVKKTTNTYEVTAHYLNIRLKPSSKADIINVVKSGDLLEAVQSDDTSWLKLKGGGYVHASYTKPLEHSATQQKVKFPMPLPVKQELGKPSTKVKSDSGLTEDHISTIFKGTALEDEGLEEVILEIEEEYGINAFFTIAVLKLESGNGKSRLAKNKNNLFGLNAIDGDAHNKAFSFKTKGDSVRKFGQLISKNYVGKGYTTIEKVATKYCPSNEDWPTLVASIMKGDYKKL